jgi:hypothetical protein
VTGEAGHVAHWHADEQYELFSDILQGGAESASEGQIKLGMSRARARVKGVDVKRSRDMSKRCESGIRGSTEKKVREL